MRILILEGTSKLGGAQFDNILIQRSKSKSLYYHTIVPEEGDLYDKLIEENRSVEIITMPKLISTSFFIKNKPILNPLAIVNNLISYYRLAIKLSKYIKDNEYDLVVTNGMNPHFYGGIAAKIAGVPVIFRLMDVIRIDMLLGFARKAFELFSSFVNANIVVPSKAVSVAMFSNDFIEANVKVIYNATDLQDFNFETAKPVLRDEFDIPMDCILFGCFSRLTPWKGQESFVNAAISLLSKGSKAKFIIVGGAVFGNDNFLNSLKKRVIKSGFKDNIIFTGFRYDMGNCIKSADVVVVPSIHPDPCPRVMVESMAMSKAMIGSNIGGIPEVISNNSTGIIFKPNDVKSLHDAFEFFLNHPDQVRIMGKNGFKRQEKLYTLENYQLEHEDFFRKKNE